MAWKQDLAKLKQQLGPEAPTAPPKVQPKAAPKPQGPAALDDEDAVFLSAMGLKPAAAPRPPKAAAGGAGTTPATPPPPPAPETFQEALKDLKGLKPLGKGRLESTPPVPAPTAAPLPKAHPPAPAPVVEAAQPEPPPEPAAPPPAMPQRFQLAAGMAIEVDGSLDLRGHSVSDAMERLKDRLGDGLVLGWRSLQVTLGADPALHEGLLGLLASGEAPMVVRFAQAPVPMGGTQAWLLYLGPPPPQP
ncbi:MAG: Smr/MutS family protein [Holophagaceae bacterium]